MNSAESLGSIYRILVVDDNQAIHDDLRKILAGESGGNPDLWQDESLLFGTVQIRGAAFEIDSAHQGQEGLMMVNRAAAEGRPYAMAFVDIRMPPGWDGVETIVHLWQSDPDLQVVICTAYSDYSWTDIVSQLGHSDSLVILKKPFDNIEVIQLAHALTRKWTVTREARIRRQDLERMVTEATAELAYCADHDTLTDLPNRRLFASLLEQAMAVARRDGETLALLYIDLDNFKAVNDTLGHDLGDELLRQVVKRMKLQLRQCDTLARMGGDEFTLIAGGLSEPGVALIVARRLREAFREVFRIDGNHLSITASVGASVYPRDGREVGELLRNADAAMYEAKRRGKNRMVMYTPEIGQRASARLELESHLRTALESRQFVLHYQPQFELRTQRLVRFEALLRWQHPALGQVPPAKFIPIAEASGLIVPIGNWVMMDACRTAKKWQEAGCQRVSVGVNVSTKQFSRADFTDTVLDIVNQVQLDPGLLELELTETVLMRNPEDATGKIARLRAHGIAISIDDFGTGYSSFSYLQKLPVDAIKIDRSFIQNLEFEPRARSVVNGMVALAHSIGLRVVVEGVETPEQLESLGATGADEVQGFLLGYPAPVERHLPELETPAPLGTAHEAGICLSVS
jgi:diguanylate cyclase (GGDEF)-like protein